MDEGVELAAEEFADFLKCRVDLLVALHVAENGGRVGNLLGQFLDIFFHAFLVGKNKLRAFAGECLRDGPANGTMVGDTGNEYLFSFKQGHDDYSSQHKTLYGSVYCTSSGSVCLSLYRVTPHHPPV